MESSKTLDRTHVPSLMGGEVLILLHFYVQSEIRIRSNKFYGRRLKASVTSSLDKAVLGESEFPITRSMLAQADFPWSGGLSTLGKGGLGWRIHLGSQILPLFSP